MNGIIPVLFILVGAIFAYRSHWFVKPEQANPIRIIGLVLLLIGINWLVFSAFL